MSDQTSERGIELPDTQFPIEKLALSLAEVSSKVIETLRQAAAEVEATIPDAKSTIKELEALLLDPIIILDEETILMLVSKILFCNYIISLDLDSRDQAHTDLLAKLSTFGEEPIEIGRLISEKKWVKLTSMLEKSSTFSSWLINGGESKNLIIRHNAYRLLNEMKQRRTVET